MKFKVLSIGLIIVIQAGCQFQKPVNSYPFYETTVDKLPPLKDVKGVLIMTSNHPSDAFYPIVIGDRKEIEEIIGFEIVVYNCDELPVKFETDPKWIEKLYKDCFEAERVPELDNYWCGYLDMGGITFVTKKAAYMVGICNDISFQAFPGYRSPELEKHFNELGIIPDRAKLKK